MNEGEPHSLQPADQSIRDAGEFLGFPRDRQAVCHLPRPQAGRFRTHHEAAPPVRSRFPNRFEQREESIFTTQLIQHPPVVTKVRSAVGIWSPTPAASRPARARYRPDAY